MKAGLVKKQKRPKFSISYCQYKHLKNIKLVYLRENLDEKVFSKGFLKYIKKLEEKNK